MIDVAVRETVTHAATRRAMQPNLLRADGGESEEIDPATVWDIVGDVGHGPHFLGWLAILELDREGVYPINSTPVRKRIREKLGAETAPNRQNVLRSMKQFKKAGALKREKLDDDSGYHWSPTEEGYRFSHAISTQWCEALGCDAAVEALRECADDSTDSDDQ